MCTIIAAFGLVPGAPLVIAANRDEFLARASLPPQQDGASPWVLAGVDQEKGGTWMGVTETGLFVGITNQRSVGRVDPAMRSRGLLVREALSWGTIEGVVSLLGRVDPSGFNPFNLLFGTARALFIAYARPDQPSIAIEQLSPGLHVLPNDVLGSKLFPKTERARSLVTPLLSLPLPTLLEGLGAVLADHHKPSPDALPSAADGALLSREVEHALSSLCVHTPIYGTRSSSIIALSDEELLRYRFADGPPCQTAFVDVITPARIAVGAMRQSERAPIIRS